MTPCSPPRRVEPCAPAYAGGSPVRWRASKNLGRRRRLGLVCRHLVISGVGCSPCPCRSTFRSFRPFRVRPAAAPPQPAPHDPFITGSGKSGAWGAPPVPRVRARTSSIISFRAEMIARTCRATPSYALLTARGGGVVGRTLGYGRVCGQEPDRGGVGWHLRPGEGARPFQTHYVR